MIQINVKSIFYFLIDKGKYADILTGMNDTDRKYNCFVGVQKRLLSGELPHIISGNIGLSYGGAFVVWSIKNAQTGAWTAYPKKPKQIKETQQTMERL